MRMFLAWLQLEQVDNIYETDLDVRKFLAEQDGGSQRLLRRYIASRSHNEVGLTALVVAGPIPDADALRAMGNRCIHIQVLQVQLFVGNDHIDVVLAAKTMIGYRQKAIGIWRKIDTRYCSALVENHVQKTGVLVRKAVVILPPNRRRDQQIQRSDLLAPGQVIADGQPFGVLVEHGIDDVDKGFVGREEAVAAG